MIISLDVDGVLADESGFFSKFKVHKPYADLAGLSTFWSMREPLVQPDLQQQFELRGMMEIYDIGLQVVSKRPVEMEATTMSWIAAHYAWLMPAIGRVYCIGAGGSKVTDVPRPDLGIDDSQTVLDEYCKAQVPCIAVSSWATAPLKCRRAGIPVVFNVLEALRGAGRYAARA